MNLFSFLMTVFFVIYAYLGSYALHLDRKASLNRVFSAFNYAFAIWSFAFAFMITSQDKAACWLWYSVASIGFCLFPAMILHFFLVYTARHTLLGKWWIYVVLYAPGTVFICQSFRGRLYAVDFLHYSIGWVEVIDTGSFWFWAFYSVLLLFCTAGLVLSYIHWKKAVIPKVKRQSGIILVSASLTEVLGIVVSALPIVFDTKFPPITPVGGLVWTLGIWYSIARYRLMVLTPSTAADSILQTIVDSVVLMDPNGLIVNYNQETQRMFGCDGKELVGKPFDTLVAEGGFNWSLVGKSKEFEPVRNIDTYYISKSGERIPIILSVSECRESGGILIGYIAVAGNITKLKEAEARLKYLAHHDTLTDLPNRLMFQDRLEEAIDRAQYSNTFLAFILIDLDNFKEVNDTLGHNTGDLMLKELSNRLESSIRRTDVIARLGGDEFVILVNDLVKSEDYETICRNIQEAVSRPFTVESNVICITSSMGISIYPYDGKDMDSLLKSADSAMYHAKSEGKNQYKLFTP